MKYCRYCEKVYDEKMNLCQECKEPLSLLNRDDGETTSGFPDLLNFIGVSIIILSVILGLLAGTDILSKLAIAVGGTLQGIVFYALGWIAKRVDK